MKNIVYDLPCYDSKKSFYGKAKVISESDTFYYLKSYNTIVCSLEWKKSGVYITKLWGGYSVTTMRHINSFLEHFDLPKMNKKEWYDLYVGKEVKVI